MQRKRILSYLLALIMIFTMIPATAFADTESSSDVNTITINVAPTTANVTFYEGYDAVKALSEEQVTDNGIVGNYHQYVLSVKDGEYSYRGVDTAGTEDTSDDVNMGGMAFDAPVEEEILSDGQASGEGQTMTLVRTNWYTTNKAITAVGDYTLRLMGGAYPDVVNGDQYIDSNSRVVTPIMVTARGNALTYQMSATVNGELGEQYAVANQQNLTFSASASSTQNKTFSVNAIVYKTITAPKEAKVQVFNQAKNFNVDEIAVKSSTENEDGTVTHVFATPGGLNLTYRASMKDKITRAGFMTGSAEEFTVTFDDSEDPATTVNDVPQIQKRMESSTLVNINSQNNLNLGVNETFRLRAFRAAWQIINTDTMNIMIEPDFNYNIVSGAEHIEMTPASNRCTGNAGTGNASNWMDIKGVSAGTTIIEVSYDAIKIDGNNTTYDGLYGATDPQRKSLVVINVGDDSEKTLKLRAKGTDRDWDTEFDTLYFTEKTGSFGFEAALGESEADKVELSVDNGKTWTDVNAKDGFYTADGLVGGNNLLKFTKGDKVEYQVVRAAKITYVITNKTREDGIIAGDTVSVSIRGMYIPVPKMSGIYNPGFQRPNHNIVYDLPEGVTAVTSGGQYDFISNHKYEVTLGTEGGFKLTNGCIYGTCMGDAMGTHRNLTDAGVGTNMSAGNNNGNKSILPDLTFDVTKMPIIAVTLNIDTEGTTVKLTDESGTECTEENGVYNLGYGAYEYCISKEGYVTERGKFNVGTKDGSEKTVNIKMRKVEGAIWDGSTATEPKIVDGVYQIGTGAELAWFAQNAGGTSYSAILTDDISLGGFEWTPIAKNSAWKGTFDGNGHYVTDLYINSEENNVALFGYVSTGAVVKNLGVKGEVTTTNRYAAGIATAKTTSLVFTIENCKSDVNVTAERYAGGIISGQSSKQSVINCYNTGKITTTRSSGGTAGGVSAPSSTSQKVVIQNSYNTGKISGKGNMGLVVPLSSSSYAVNVQNCYGLIGKCDATTVAGKDVTISELRALASTLGDAYLDNQTSYNNGYPILKWEEAHVLPIAKEEAIADITSGHKASDYRTREKEIFEDAVATANSAIEKATTLAEVAAAEKTAKAEIDELKTDAEYTAEELKEAKTAAIADLEKYKNKDAYREAQQTELANIIAEASSAMDAAASVKEIEEITAKAKATMDNIKTDEQMTFDEKLAAVEKAKAEAEAAQKAAEEAKKEADAAKAEAEKAKAEAETAKTDAEKAKTEAEAAADAAREAQEAAEKAKAEAEKAKAEAEAAIAAAIPVTEVTGTSTSVTSVKLSWEKITGVDGYIIKRAKVNGKYEEIKVIKGNRTTSLTNSKLVCGTTYSYVVRAYRVIDGKTYIGEASDAFKIKAKPAKITLKSVKAKNNAAKVIWAKQSNVTGYKIYRATSKSGTYKLVKTIKSYKTTSWTNTKLKDKKKYYYKVRAYKTVKGNAVYGNYSSVKSVKTK